MGVKLSIDAVGTEIDHHSIDRPSLLVVDRVPALVLFRSDFDFRISASTATHLADLSFIAVLEYHLPPLLAHYYVAS